MAVLCRLADPEGYVACTWDLVGDARGRAYWLGHFAAHSKTILELVRQRLGDGAETRIAGFEREFAELLRRLGGEPESFAPLTILRLDEHREQMLERHGFDDLFREVKNREYDAAVGLYPRVMEELGGHEGVDLMEKLVRGIFAGNIFDLGSMATVEAYRREGLDFFATRAQQPGRPWLVDDFDALARRFCDGRGSPYRQALFFVDNAGADLVLGCLPFARQLGLWGTRVVLAANSRPSLNDATAGEVQKVLGRLCDVDGRLGELVAAGRMRVVASGGWAPLIDLSRVSEACNEAAREADLIILEGMGRSVESNHEAEFDCDCLKIALLKDEAVAKRIGGKIFDAVCRFEVVGASG